jgi:hypothetical protein
MVLKRSRIKGGSLQSRLCRSGTVSCVNEKGFQIKFNDREMVWISKNEGIEYSAPRNKKNVVCLYNGKKDEKYISEVRSRTWELFYRKEI